MKIEFLGTADSAGIPSHNCSCQICCEYRKKGITNLATSAYIKCDNGEIILLDAGIENISTLFDGQKINAIFLTHFHADHCLGLLRLRYSKDVINCFHPKDADGFSDLFKHKHSIEYKELNEFEKTSIKGINFTSIPLKHSKKTFGYLIEYKNKTIGYLTDCSGIDKKTFDFLSTKKLDYAFIDACYDERKVSGNHLNYLQATELLDALHVDNGFLMHASHTTLEYILNNKVDLKYPYVDNTYGILI